MDQDLDCGWPMYNALGSVPPNDIAKISLWRLLFQRYECTPAEIAAVQAELAADRLDGRRCETTIPGIVEQLRGGEYLIPLGHEPPLMVNWLCHHIRPGVYTEERRQLARWLGEALAEARRRERIVQ